MAVEMIPHQCWTPWQNADQRCNECLFVSRARTVMFIYCLFVNFPNFVPCVAWRSSLYVDKKVKSTRAPMLLQARYSTALDSFTPEHSTTWRTSPSRRSQSASISAG